MEGGIKEALTHYPIFKTIKVSELFIYPIFTQYLPIKIVLF
jgi:hypothetical protein